MSVLRALRRVVAAIWSAVDLEDCTTVASYAAVGYGCYLLHPAYGFIVPGALVIVPRVLLTLLQGVTSSRAEGRRWAA